MVRWRIGRDPLWQEFDRLQKGMNELFHAMSGGTPRSFFDPLWREARIFPLLNVKEMDDSYVVTAEIPGMKTEDLDIKVIGDTLTLKGERKPIEIGEGASYHRRERATGTFQRSLTLPGRVEPEGVKANYKNGILTVTLQKEAKAQPKQISITAE
ncbi:Hsp20/alpha crystallin family protein [Desulfomonile tiedjei]|uniref:Molecular chaperone (Small heat shock protein) n=1 Tax=Desulfomonile tiedjei (strain ATCC 49306 / DSM 6799 / DCB-1) TaxID=706587 RepID=I4CB37_DESTA|nr:Hsp20/alpha crystallin family protein [Desulfomonile tiedjei]AFM26778.1 molecular chaperone (small heat shock protein) [Desulfomonile tiedjei DSM 6799]